MLKALADKKVVPDLLVGTSVGALNAAFLAGRPSLDAADELADLWRGLQRSDIFPTNPLRGIAGLIGRRDHLVNPKALRKVLAQILLFEELEDALVPFRCVATDLLTGEQVELSHGSAASAVMASAALPGVLPPVEIDGRQLIDGGISNNVPIANAVSAGATTIYVLPAGHACAPARRPKGALHVLLHSMSVIVHDRLAGHVELHEGDVDLRVMPALCPVSVSIADFSQTTELIARSYEQSSEWLESEPARASVYPPRHYHHLDQPVVATAAVSETRALRPEVT